MFQWRGNPVFVSSFGNQRSLSPQHLIEIRSGEEEGEEGINTVLKSYLLLILAFQSQPPILVLNGV